VVPSYDLVSMLECREDDDARAGGGKDVVFYYTEDQWFLTKQRQSTIRLSRFKVKVPCTVLYLFSSL
jgi:hypothetical protein